MPDDSLFITVTGIAAGVFTSISALPQVIKTLKTKDAKDVSAVMLIVLILGVGLWTYYGILKNDFPIIITNAFSTLLNIFMLILKLIYGKKGKAGS